ncbi:hypothetical protein, partial [Corynebacterium dentalis]|uniref:hypothetical protein n=1 Tax=Corynebacterium dentalis TaxID=2014528 RepID=UPI00289AA3A3
ARLRVSELRHSPGLDSQFDVISYGEVRLEANGMSRSHSLYFADFDSPRTYSWFELGFMSMLGGDFDNDPRAEPPSRGFSAFDGVIGGLQLAWGIESLDIGDLDSFVDFWADRFGRAAKGRFPRLSQLPDGRTKRPAGQR